MNETHMILVYPEEKVGVISVKPVPELIDGKEALLHRVHELTRRGADFKVWEVGKLVGDFVKLIEKGE